MIHSSPEARTAAPAGRRAGHNGGTRCGTATVEFAVLLCMFLATFLYGMLEVSRAVQVTQVLANAARAGCRQGIITGNDNSSITTAVDAVMQANGLTTYQPVSITVSDPNNSSNTTDAGAAGTGSQITVQVSIQASNFAWLGTYIFFSSSGTGSTVYSQSLTMRKQ